MEVIPNARKIAVNKRNIDIFSSFVDISKV